MRDIFIPKFAREIILIYLCANKKKQMELISQTTELTKIVETIVKREDTVYIVRDFYNVDTNKIIDTTMTTKNGFTVDDSKEFDDVINFIDSLES